MNKKLLRVNEEGLYKIMTLVMVSSTFASLVLPLGRSRLQLPVSLESLQFSHVA